MLVSAAVLASALGCAPKPEPRAVGVTPTPKSPVATTPLPMAPTQKAPPMIALVEPLLVATTEPSPIVPAPPSLRGDILPDLHDVPRPLPSFLPTADRAHRAGRSTVRR